MMSFIIGLIRRFQQSHLPLLTAALAYYAAFSLGPLLLLLGGWLGVVLNQRPELAMQYQLALADLLAQIMPPQSNSQQLIDNSFKVIIDQLGEGALLRSIISFFVLIWASSNFFTSLQLALEVIFNVPESRGYWRKRLVALGLVIMVAVVIGIEIIGGVFLSFLHQVSDAIVVSLQQINIFLPEVSFGWQQGTWTQLLRIIIATLAFTLCFRYIPRKSSSWLGALLGALFSTLSILIMRQVLPIFFQIERFNLIYGVVTSLLIILVWLYFALLLFLLGALLVAEISANQRIAKALESEV